MAKSPSIIRTGGAGGITFFADHVLAFPDGGLISTIGPQFGSALSDLVHSDLQVRSDDGSREMIRTSREFFGAIKSVNMRKIGWPLPRCLKVDAGSTREKAWFRPLPCVDERQSGQR